MTTTKLTDEQIAERARHLTMRNPRVYFQGWAGDNREDITDEVRSLLAEVRASRSSSGSGESEPCACRKAVPGMWTSGYDATVRSFVRHGAKECEEFTRRASGSGEREAGLRERIEAMAVEWETEAARRAADAKTRKGQERKALNLGAEFERHHAARLRALSSGSPSPATGDET